MILPALVEVHCHLDKCHTVDRLAAVGGDLPAAITAQAADKANWTEPDLRARAGRGLAEAQAAGVGLLRTHVDWGEAAEPPLAWRVIRELAEEAPGIIVERAALTGIDQLAHMGEEIAAHVARDGGVLGSFIRGHPETRAGLIAAIRAAETHGLALDFHVDEGLEDGLDGSEAIAEAVIETGFQGPVLCGHACSLMNRTGDALKRLIEKVARAGIAVAALPATNLYLQGRAQGTPDRRGITRLRELHAAGVPIVVGSDNVADAFGPTGAHDPLAALNLAVLGAHLDPPLDRWLRAVTTDAARALGRAPAHVLGAGLHDLRISDAASVSDLVSGRRAPPRPITQDDLETDR